MSPDTVILPLNTYSALQSLYPDVQGDIEIERSASREGYRYRCWGVKGRTRLGLTITPEVLGGLSPQFVSNGRALLPDPYTPQHAPRLFALAAGDLWNDLQPELIAALRTDALTPGYAALWNVIERRFETSAQQFPHKPLVLRFTVRQRSHSTLRRSAEFLCGLEGSSETLRLSVYREQNQTEGFQVYGQDGSPLFISPAVLAACPGLLQNSCLPTPQGAVSLSDYQAAPQRYAAAVSQALTQQFSQAKLGQPAALQGLSAHLQDLLFRGLPLPPLARLVGSLWLPPLPRSGAALRSSP